ncbi:hypothetical protein QFC22_002133 [Naganishia vaughanmartiniae]|uniref:Uncharacterized protein n=1 Tax=Naganishia vaughanmartiniae TaxID=1424756 RepID=A0ACC2XDR9_9TREE|nr:hypothetical protein QFC22_002133 [Naganishia vaughanmartiniae]
MDFARDKPAHHSSSSSSNKQPSPLRTPANSTSVRSPAPQTSIDSAGSSAVAHSSAGGSGSSVSSSLLAGHHQHASTAQSRTLSSVLDDSDDGSDIGTPGQPIMFHQQNVSAAEDSAGVAMSGIPIVNIQDPQGGARQMSVDAMDVGGLSLTGQATPPHPEQYGQQQHQQRDVHGHVEQARMRDKMQEAQAQPNPSFAALQAEQAQAQAEYAAQQARAAALNAQASQAAYEQAQAQARIHAEAVSQQQQQQQQQQQPQHQQTQQVQQQQQQQAASPVPSPSPVELGYITTSSGVRVPVVPSVRKTAGRYSLNDFQIERTLGTGSFGRVHLVRSRHNGRFYAVKVLNKEKVVRMKQVEHSNSERDMLVRVRHPFLVNLWGTFHDVNNLYMTMDFVAGGELFSLLRKSQRFPNSVAKFYAAEVALALDYLHSLDIIYRDLKPENLLLGADGHVKVTDFGFAKFVPDITWTLCGTPDYLAPEVVQSKGYNKSVDWYALGVLIFEMLAGYPPFFTEDGNPMKLYEKIIAGKVRYPTYFDATAKELLKNLLVGDLSKRFGNLRSGAADIFNHPWFEEVDWEKLYRREIPAPYVPRIEGDGDASQ